MSAALGLAVTTFTAFAILGTLIAPTGIAGRLMPDRTALGGTTRIASSTTTLTRLLGFGGGCDVFVTVR